MTNILPAVTKRKAIQRDNLHSGRTDCFQTPPEALRPLLPYLRHSEHPERRQWKIWEPACGKGNLVRGLHKAGFCGAFGTDIKAELSDPELGAIDFLGSPAAFPDFDCVITNPPYSIKNAWLARAYELGKPFALLLPITALETGYRQKLFRENGVEIIFFEKRINFETPSWTEEKPGSSWFECAYFTSGLGIGRFDTWAEWDKLPPLVEGSEGKS